MSDKSIRRKVEAIRRQKMTSEKVVSLDDYRQFKESAEIATVLVVDDDETMRGGLKRVLTAEGYRVILAEDGLELSKVLETTSLDLVLLDVNLPWVDGYELCQLIKNHQSLREVPLIFLSGRNSKRDIERGFDVGCNNYITKPFEIDHIISTVRQLIEANAD